MIRHNGIEIDRKAQIIRHRGKQKFFDRRWLGGSKPTAFRLWEALIIGDCNRPQLFELLYGDDADGGPEQGLNILNVKVALCRRQFAALELKWVSEKRGGLAYWRLIPDYVV